MDLLCTGPSFHGADLMFGVMGEPVETACISVGPLAGWEGGYEVTTIEHVVPPCQNKCVCLRVLIMARTLTCDQCMGGKLTCGYGCIGSATLSPGEGPLFRISQRIQC